MSRPRAIIKIGGSLFDMPHLRGRLLRWLDCSLYPGDLLIPGGGPTADAIRDFDQRHALGEEKAHWLALRALSLNAHILAAFFPTADVIGDPAMSMSCWQSGRLPVLDAHAFALADEGRHGCLPHSWNVTSDSVAARVAVVTGAGLLFLLKSITIPESVDWDEAAQRGWVDGMFADVVRQSPTLQVRAINLREWAE